MTIGRTTFALAVATMALGTTCAQAAEADRPPLTYDVIRTSEISLNANITLISGEKEAVLIDVPFSRADALRVAADVLDSGKTLKAILITHDHPDHFFGLDVLHSEFPDAEIIAAPVVVTDMTRSVPIKFERWSEQLGANAPRLPVIPAAMDSDTFLLEGYPLKVIGPMQGDHVRSTVIWDEGSRTLVAGDAIYNGMFVWLGEHTPDRYVAWLGVLDQLEAMKPQRVIAGHTRPDLSNDNASIEWTRNYITYFAEASRKAATSAQMQEIIRARFPEATDVLGCFLLCTSAQVAVGEIEPWDE